uniref:PREDICTED: similar to dynein putative n=1 Tax=Albugo laibachii Nc14 TaxID=890382 RepID=F0X1V5_9STRA|nr:PREDICTED: similar to dynein putative [Albugo laibachii Nc14]|eukprot:CCA27812.1 PREDICTED: similar to dynein putative [Albugo laibachii Nc14]
MDAEARKRDLDEFYGITYGEAEIAGSSNEDKTEFERRADEVMSQGEISREIMNALLPPKYLTNHPKLGSDLDSRTWMMSEKPKAKWQRLVSRALVSRQGVIRYQTLLDTLLLTQKARSRPICQIREKLFLQAFDEIIRQVACQCPEQGLLLLRVRDERRMTMSMYQTLYHDSLNASFTTDLEPNVQVELRLEKCKLQEEKDKLSRRLQFLEAEMAHSAEKRAQKHQAIARALRLRNTQLQRFAQVLEA